MRVILSFDIVLYMMVSGFFPFLGINEKELQKNILSGKFTIKDVAKEIKDLINAFIISSSIYYKFKV